MECLGIISYEVTTSFEMNSVKINLNQNKKVLEFTFSNKEKLDIEEIAFDIYCFDELDNRIDKIEVVKNDSASKEENVSYLQEIPLETTYGVIVLKYYKINNEIIKKNEKKIFATEQRIAKEIEEYLLTGKVNKIKVDLDESNETKEDHLSETYEEQFVDIDPEIELLNSPSEVKKMNNVNQIYGLISIIIIMLTVLVFMFVPLFEGLVYVSHSIMYNMISALVLVALVIIKPRNKIVKLSVFLINTILFIYSVRSSFDSTRIISYFILSILLFKPFNSKSNMPFAVLSVSALLISKVINCVLFFDSIQKLLEHNVMFYFIIFVQYCGCLFSVICINESLMLIKRKNPKCISIIQISFVVESFLYILILTFVTPSMKSILDLIITSLAFGLILVRYILCANKNSPLEFVGLKHGEAISIILLIFALTIFALGFFIR